ncbi:uncharacterized protein ACBT44_013471 [Syngnathus typhle]
MTAASSPSSQSSQVECVLPCHRREFNSNQTRLRLRSAPGAWLIVGVLVVALGMCVAMAGYVASPPRHLGAPRSTHKDKMKLAGPMVMGVGLFIFICAASLLYENRDREIHMLKKCKDPEDKKGDWEDWQEQAIFSGQKQWEIRDEEQERSLYPPSLSCKNIEDINKSLQRHLDAEDEAEREGKSTLVAQVLHHQEPSPHSSSLGHSGPHPSAFPDKSSKINTRTCSALPEP